MPEQDSSTRSFEVVVTSFHAGRTGGVIIGRKAQHDAIIRALVPRHLLARDPLPGEIWRLTGTLRAHPEFGLQLHVRVALPLLPQGRAIVRYLATNPAFRGIGWGLANRLWDRLGESLYDAIKTHDPVPIAEAIGHDLAMVVIDQFGLLAEEVEVFRWLDRYGVSPRTAGAAARLWGSAAVEKIKLDPYALALLEPWTEVDQRAMRLGVAPDDPRRLQAAIDEAFSICYRRGDTAGAMQEILDLLPSLLPSCDVSLLGPAVQSLVSKGRVVRHKSDLLQSRAICFMEREVERMIAMRLQRETIAPPGSEIADAIAGIEAQEGYQLTRAQREAVYMAVSSPVSIISGGAGTGKTTVVRAVLAASERRRLALPTEERQGFEFPQVALAGRAVKRITEATGREASTIARFMHALRSGRRKPKRGLMVFDESSMLDLPALYQLLSALPSEMDLLFIGDPAQLPPIGPGLVFHRMVESQDVPKVVLDVIHRQDSKTGIPIVAAAIRDGRLPDLPTFDPSDALGHGVFIVHAKEPEEIASRARAVFLAMAAHSTDKPVLQEVHDRDIQILCATKRGPAGASALNESIERDLTKDRPPIHDWGLAVGSKVIWLKNDYSKAPQRDSSGQILRDPDSGEPVCAGFMNGALGIVRRATGSGAWIEFDDGAEDEVTASDLEKLTLGWAISVHKAQGSAFRRVVVPVMPSRLVDRALLYTAITRAVETAVLIGDEDLIRQAVAEVPTAYRRVTTIDFTQLSALGEHE